MLLRSSGTPSEICVTLTTHVQPFLVMEKMLQFVAPIRNELGNLNLICLAALKQVPYTEHERLREAMRFTAISQAFSRPAY